MPRAASAVRADFRHHPVVQVNAANLERRCPEAQRLRARPWWIVCSEVDVSELREEIRRDKFSVIRAGRLTGEVRAELKAKVAVEQRARYERERRIKYGSVSV